MDIQNWVSATATAEYDQYDNLLPRTFGHPFVFRAMGLGDGDVHDVLDYGCGPGWVAARAAREFGVNVLAVDVARTMIERSARLHQDPRLTFHHVPDGRVDIRKAGSMDGAMCCSVLTCVSRLDTIRFIVGEVFRLLRPGARFAILENNPDATGVQFSHVRCGEPGESYASGQPRSALLRRRDGRFMVTEVYHWTTANYRSALEEAGFCDVTVAAPVLADAQGLADPKDLAEGGWAERADAPERHRAPYLTISGHVPLT